ncbi:hypothetical protein [Streptomyces sp. NPDC017993]|uniref:hypothetical protein n=1 Tax=Streptomyces sp. NPDC017993 TaxID=3365027 RepID=UPI0037B1C24B
MSWPNRLSTLAFATVVETSISACLHMLADDADIWHYSRTSVWAVPGLTTVT